MGARIKLNKRTIIATFMAVILALGMAVPITASYADPTAAEKQAEADAAKVKLEEMQATLDAAQQKLDETSDAYYIALDEQEAAEQAVEEAKQRVEEKTREIEGYQEKLGNRARSMYRSGSTSFIDVILGASSFEDFATTWNTLEMLNEDDAELVQQTKDAREELQEAEAEAERQAQIATEKAEEARVAKEEAEAATAEAEAATAETQALYDSLSAEAAELLAQEEAAAEAARLAAAQAAAASSSYSGQTYNDAVQTVTGNIVVDRAYAQLGKPYVWGASGPNSFDCSGLVGYCITGVYGSHWCTTSTMASWKRVTNPQPGDFCLNSHHTGIYIGNGQMIHAPHTGDVVKISAVHSGMWYVRY